MLAESTSALLLQLLVLPQAVLPAPTLRPIPPAAVADECTLGGLERVRLHRREVQLRQRALWALALPSVTVRGQLLARGGAGLAPVPAGWAVLVEARWALERPSPLARSLDLDPCRRPRELDVADGADRADPELTGRTRRPEERP